MNLKFTLLCLLLISFNICFADDSIPKLDSTDLTDGKITRTETYDGSSLWGYIDGAADLYLEYGFVGLQVQNINWGKNKFTINVYQMTDSESAFGIFSVLKFNCAFSDSSSFIKCTAPYQTQIVSGNYYISIIDNSGSSEAQKQSGVLSQTLLQKFEKKEQMIFPKMFTGEVFSTYLSDLKYFKGIIGIQNRAQEWIERFENVKNYSVYYLPIDDEKGSTIISQITFQDAGELKSFLVQFDSTLIPEKKGKIYNREHDGKTLMLWSSSETRVFLMESSSQKEKFQKYIKEIEKAL